jgi:peptidyl-prolyl cis-trans isomerase C
MNRSLTAMLREPIAYFVLIGIALFAIDKLWIQAGAENEQTQITIERHRLLEMRQAFEAETGRQPEPAEWARRVEEEIELEVLYREALALGLHRNDLATKQRLAQKALFVYEHQRRPKRPSESPWYAALKAKYQIRVEDLEAP